MTWVAWRQHRGQAAVMAALLAAISAYMLVVGWQVTATAERVGLTDCLAAGGDCGQLATALVQRFDLLVGLTIFTAWLPLLVGAFWGAPLLARELERGTHLLAWTQSVTRARWLAVRVALVAASAVVAMSLLGAVSGWLHAAYYGRVGGGTDANLAEMHDLMPPALALATLGLGVAAGALLRRTLPAMGVTLAGGFLLWNALRWLGNLLVPPLRRVAPLGELAATGQGGWRVGGGYLDRVGEQVPFEEVARLCPEGAGALTSFVDCAARYGYRSYVLYQPDERYWLIQGASAAVLVALGLCLLAVAFWAVRRRLR